MQVPASSNHHLADYPNPRTKRRFIAPVSDLHFISHAFGDTPSCLFEWALPKSCVMKSRLFPNFTCLLKRPAERLHQTKLEKSARIRSSVARERFQYPADMPKKKSDYYL